MAKKKVLYVITKDDIGGAQKYVHDLAANLDKEKFEAKILYGGTDIKWLSNKIKPHFLFLNDWLSIFELVRIFERERPDIIHLNSSKAGIIGSLSARFYKLLNRLRPQTSNLQSPKVIFTAHGWVFNPTNYINAPTRRFYILLHKFAALFQEKIINVSEYDKNIAFKYNIAPENKLIKIYNGIEKNISFLDKKTAREEILKKLEAESWKLEARLPWVGSIGRLTPEKNYETLIQAAALAPEAYFFIIGKGSEKNKLRSLIAKLNLQNKFFLVDASGDDAIFLKAFDIFVLPSIKEGMPYILLEAMAAGLPSVVTDAGGMPEIIENGIEGLIINKKNSRMLADAVKLLLADPKSAEISAKGALEKSRKDFSLDKMVDATEKLYCQD